MITHSKQELHKEFMNVNIIMTCDNYEALARIIQSGYDFNVVNSWAYKSALDCAAREETVSVDMLRFVLQNTNADAARVWRFMVRDEDKYRELVRYGMSGRGEQFDYINKIKEICVTLIWLSQKKQIPLLNNYIIIQDIAKRIYDQRMK